MANSNEYNNWRSMRSRCNDVNNEKYERYGARGIKVCKEWDESFDSFYKDTGSPPFKGATLGRIDNDLGYYKENIRWENPTQQARNRSSNKIIEYNGKTKILIEWAEEKGIPMKELSKRIKRGWDIDRALNQPLRGRK